MTKTKVAPFYLGHRVVQLNFCLDCYVTQRKKAVCRCCEQTSSSFVWTWWTFRCWYRGVTHYTQAWHTGRGECRWRRGVSKLTLANSLQDSFYRVGCSGMVDWCWLYKDGW